MSLAAQQLRAGARFYLLDGSPAGSLQSAALASLAEIDEPIDVKPAYTNRFLPVVE